MGIEMISRTVNLNEWKDFAPIKSKKKATSRMHK